MKEDFDLLLIDSLDFGHGHPLVTKDLISKDSSILISDHFSNDIDCLLGLVLPLDRGEVKLSLLDSLQNLLVTLSIEGRIAAEQNIEDDSSTPDIALFIVVSSQDFRGDVKWSSGLGLENGSCFSLLGVIIGGDVIEGLVGLIESSTETKVNDLKSKGILLGNHDEILRLEIPVNDSINVTVMKGCHDLSEDDSGVLLIVVFIGDDSVKELSSGAELKDEIDVLGILEVVH